MEQSSGQANSFSASQEIPRILWNLKVHYRIHNSPPPVLIMGQFNQTHGSLTPNLQDPLYITLQPALGHPSGLISLLKSCIYFFLKYMLYVPTTSLFLTSSSE